MSNTKSVVREREAAYHDSALALHSFYFANSLGIQNLGYGTYCEALRWRDALQLLGDMRNKALLDVGCGTGKNSLIFAKLGARVTGIDVSEKSVQTAREWAKRQGLRADFCVCAAEELNKVCRPCSVDIVIFHAVMHHVSDPNSAIRSALSVLKPGGILIALEPKAENPIAIIGRKYMHVCMPTLDEHPFRLGELEVIMERHFGNVKSKHYCLISPLYLGFHIFRLKSLGYFLFVLMDLIDKALLSTNQFKRWTWLELVWCYKSTDA